MSAPQSKYCGGCRLIENARLVSFALILSGMLRASQIEKLWKWIILRYTCETCVLKLNAFVRQIKITTIKTTQCFFNDL